MNRAPLGVDSVTLARNPSYNFRKKINGKICLREKKSSPTGHSVAGCGERVAFMYYYINLSSFYVQFYYTRIFYTFQ